MKIDELERHNLTQHNDTQYNDTQHNYTQYNVNKEYWVHLSDIPVWLHSE